MRLALASTTCTLTEARQNGDAYIVLHTHRTHDNAYTSMHRLNTKIHAPIVKMITLPSDIAEPKPMTHSAICVKVGPQGLRNGHLQRSKGDEASKPQRSAAA